MNTTTKGDYSILLIGLAAVLAGLLGVEISSIKHKLELDWSDWLGFAGAIFGGLATVGAAMIAWRAVRNQNKVTIQLAHRREVESHDLAASLINPLVETVAACWLIFDTAEDLPDAAGKKGVACGTSYFFEAETKNELDEMDGLGQQLSPFDEWNFRHLIKQMRIFSSLCSHIYAHPSESKIDLLRFRLTMLQRAAIKFEPAFEPVFEGLKRAEFIETTTAKALRDKAAHYKRTGNID